MDRVSVGAKHFWKNGRAAAIAAVLALGLSASHGSAQLFGERLNLDLHAGGATYGRFLEQLTGGTLLVLQERELKGKTAWTFGGSAGWDTTLFGIAGIGAQLGLDWTGTEFQWKNDDPSIPGDFDNSDAGNLTTWVLSLNIMTFIGDNEDLMPYLVFGLNGTWWQMETQLNPVRGNVLPILTGGETSFKLGATGGLGLHVGLGDDWGTRLEAIRYSVRNPFDGNGDDAFGTSTGLTTSEPDRVTIGRYSIGLVYSFEWM